MKRNLFLLIMVMLLAAMPVMAEITADMTVNDDPWGKVYTFATQTDSIENDTSRVFSFGELLTIQTDYDANYCQVPMAYKISSTLGAVNVTIKIEKSFDYDPGDSTGTWLSAFTITDSCSSEAAADTVIDIGSDRAPYYRAITDGLATNRSDSVAELWIYDYSKRY